MTIDLVEFFSVFPVIEMNRVRLREIRVEDAEDFFIYINNDNVKTFLSEDDSPQTIEKARDELAYWGKLFKYKHCLYWAIADKYTDRIIGTCGFNNWSQCHQRAEISYDLDFNYWGKGVMTEIIGKICEFAFMKMDVNRVQATVVKENIGSIKVLEKNKFKQEGFLREFANIKGSKFDSLMYSLLRSEAK